MSTDRPMLRRRTYLDANLYIYGFEGIETYRTRMVGLLAAVSTARFDLRDGKIVDSRTAR